MTALRAPILAVQLSTLLLAAHTAVADSDPIDTPPPTTEPVAAARYPRAVIARPLTFPRGVIGFGADATSNKNGSTMYAAPIAGYGFTDKAELQVGYAFATNSFEARGTLAADIGYAVIRGALDGKLEAIARARAGYDVLGNAATPFMLGLHVQYNVTPWLALISGTPGNQQIAISPADNADDKKPAFVQLPVAIGVQPSELLYVQLDTKLGRVGLHDSANAIIVRDETPLALTVVYNVLNALDLQVAVGADVSAEAVGDSFSALFGVRYYGGDL